ncbi:palmitoyltransferase ZDHHC19-like [Sciurus carolinensis]|uniref:palmitoyltransferase ZDHHC19-like n=1 Tax=Sciurus carolinensis TaxID=30640 RepID=UPI001FB49FED|nr:palmitoyltransferase ZDHHC19-like [Sciurus carolinensis]
MDVKPPTQPVVGNSWLMPSVMAAFNVVMMVMFSGFFFIFPCRWLFQTGEWVYLVITVPLFLFTLGSIIYLNFSDPGTMHRGSLEEDPKSCYVARVKHRAFCLQWCAKCSFHSPPRTVHCPRCDICVEEFDHHNGWVNNCVGRRNIRIYLVMLGSLSLYLGALLGTCLIFILRTKHLSLSLDKVMTFVVVVPVAVALLPVILRLVIQAVSVSTARRPYQRKSQSFEGDNPFDRGCINNCYATLCTPLGPNPALQWKASSLSYPVIRDVHMKPGCEPHMEALGAQPPNSPPLLGVP